MIRVRVKLGDVALSCCRNGYRLHMVTDCTWLQIAMMHNSAKSMLFEECSLYKVTQFSTQFSGVTLEAAIRISWEFRQEKAGVDQFSTS